MVAGEQIEIIRNNPPDSDATHPAQPGAQQQNPQSKRAKKIRRYLSANPENTRLAFVHDQVANSRQHNRKKRFYGYLRNQIQGEEKKATVLELTEIAGKMNDADKRELA